MKTRVKRGLRINEIRIPPVIRKEENQGNNGSYPMTAKGDEYHVKLFISRKGKLFISSHGNTSSAGPLYCAR